MLFTRTPVLKVPVGVAVVEAYIKRPTDNDWVKLEGVEKVIQKDTNVVSVDFTKGNLAQVRGPVALKLNPNPNPNPNPDGRADEYHVSLTVPRDRPGVALAQITRYQNSQYAPPVAVESATPGVIKVFSRVAPTHLALRGTIGAPATGVEFVTAWETGGYIVAALPGEAAAAAANEWAYRLSLPVLAPGVKGFVGVRVLTTEGHYYLPTALAFTIEPLVTELAAPTVELDKPDKANTAAPTKAKVDPGRAGGPVYYTKNPTVKVNVTPAAATPPQVVLLSVDSSTPNYQLLPPAPNTAWSKEIPLETDGTHTIQAVAARGDVLGAPTTVEVRVRTRGPTVEGVYAPAFGTGGGTEKIVLRLSARSQLDPTSAARPGNYFVRHVESAGVKVATVTAAVYDPVADTITLTVTGVVPGSYTVGVGAIPAKSEPPTPPTGQTEEQRRAAEAAAAAAGKLVDLFGNPLDAPAGLDAGVYFQATLFTQTIEQLPSQQAGVTLQTGPYVAFPEYTRFRRVQDGFNPSDRVETRVARLYYYRDAHRVAMIVNRSVKSYAAADVDVRRRAADRARDDANNATDERKRLEGQAVKAAQDARAAEAQLQELQQRQATAKVEAATARNLLPQRELQLQQATRDLGRGTDAVGGRADLDDALLRQQRLVLDLGEQSKQLQASIDAIPATPPAPSGPRWSPASVIRTSSWTWRRGGKR